MANITYYVVVGFSPDEDGTLLLGEPKEAPNGDLASRRAQGLFTAPGNVGALAFSRTGDLDRGDFATLATRHPNE